MSFNSSDSLLQFARQFFQLNGAAIENRINGVDVLLPENLAVRLNTPDYIHITTDQDVEETGNSLVIQYGSALLEKITDAVCSNVPLMDCDLNFHYIKQQGFDKLIRDQFVFQNAVGRVQSTADVRTEYLLLNCRYLAQSDEQKEGIVILAFNLESGASISGMDSMIGMMDKTFDTDLKKSLLEDCKIQEVMTWVQYHIGRVLKEETRSFQDSMNRRYQRDVLNLEAYYEDLAKEMQENLKRTGLSDQLISDRKEKISMIPDELRKKKDDLFKKYSIRIKIGLCGGIHILTPTMKILYQISSGKKQKQLSMTYNPVNKSMDPLVCQGCGDSAYHIGFCDHLHLLCPSCTGNCPVCSS